jgi:truncated hemoglobin YjbI
MSSKLGNQAGIDEQEIRLLVEKIFEKINQHPELQNTYPEEVNIAQKRLYQALINLSRVLQTSSRPGKNEEQAWILNENIREIWMEKIRNACEPASTDPEVKEMISKFFLRLANLRVAYE